MKKLSLLFLLVMLGMGAFAQETRYWSGKSSGSDNINETTNWWDGVVPNSGDHLEFNNTNGRHWAYSNYGNGSYFGIIIIKEGAGSIKFLGDNTYALKFENNSENELFDIANGTIGNRLGSDLEINPVGTGGILVSGSYITLDGAKILHFYGANIATINSEIKELNGISSVNVHDSKVILKSVSTYSGTTTIDNLGVLEVQKDISSSEIIVNSGAKLIINGNDVDVQKLTINSGGTVEIQADKSLTINGNLVNNGTFTVKSGATIKTAGTVTGTGTTNVEQALASGRSWWYLASPVSGATSNVIAPTSSPNKIGEYFENYIETPTDNASTTVPYYSDPFAAGSSTALTVGKGYVVKFSDTNAKTVTFTGGSLNTGDLTLTPTRTGTTAAKRGFNLVGNPYPSYLNWKEVYDATTTQNMRPTIWYRTFDAITTENPTGMVFQTYNASLNVGVPSGTNQYVAPMQAFWVKVDKDGTTGDPVSSTGTIKFTNDNRDHAITGTTSLLKAPALIEKQIIRLQLVNGAINDETVIVGVPEANDNYDLYDSEKMSISDTSMEIYTLAGTEKLIINGMNSLTEGKTVTLGFRPGQAGTFTIEATQLENIDAKVVLVDKVAVKEQELTAETPYTFVSDETPTNDRFLIKLVSKVPTGVDNTAATGDLTVYVNRNNRIQLICGIELNDQATVTVYNVAGQKLSTQKLSKSTAELNGTYNPGVYMIQLTNGSQATTKKLIIR